MEELLGKFVNVIVDRPLGTIHPNHQDIYYPVNYGFIKGIMAPDGEWQDAYILGIDYPVASFKGIVIAIVHRNNDIEEKLVVAPNGVNFSEEEIISKVYFQEQYFDFYLIMNR